MWLLSTITNSPQMWVFIPRHVGVCGRLPQWRRSGFLHLWKFSSQSFAPRQNPDFHVQRILGIWLRPNQSNHLCELGCGRDQQRGRGSTWNPHLGGVCDCGQEPHSLFLIDLFFTSSFRSLAELSRKYRVSHMVPPINIPHQRPPPTTRLTLCIARSLSFDICTLTVSYRIVLLP